MENKNNNLNSSAIYHRILKGLNDMSLRDLMASPGYFALLEQIGISMLKQGETIYPYFYAREEGDTGCTDGQSIWINTWSPMSLKVEEFNDELVKINKPSWFSQLPSSCSIQQMSYLVNVGLLCHEFGHVLYSNFKEYETQLNETLTGKFNGCKEEQQLKKLLKSSFKESLLNNIRFIANSVEDGYIENCLAMEYPNNGIVVRGLQNARDMLFYSSPSLLEQERMIENGEIDIPTVFCNWLLLVVRGFEPKDIGKCKGKLHEFISEAIENAKPFVDDYIKSSKNHYKDLAALFDILSTLYPEPRKNKNSNNGEGEEGEKQNQSNNSEMGSNKQEEQKESNDSSGSNNNSSQETKDSNGGSSNTNNSSSNSGSSSNQKENSNEDLKNNQSPSNSEKVNNERRKMGMNEKEFEGRNGCEANHSPLRNPYRENEEDELAKKQEAADRAMQSAKKSNDQTPLNEDVLRKLAKQLLEKEVANKQKEELKECFEGISGYFEREECKITEISQVKSDAGDKVAYDKIYDYLKPTVKACVRKINQILKKREYDDEDTGFSFGQRLVGREVYRQDKKCFSRELCPDNEPDVVFSIMVDQSGSMGGNKIETAKRTTILFDAVARELGIPTRIIGHTTDGTAVVYNYRNYETNDKEKYSLTNIRAYAGNVDTLILTGLCEDLLKRKEENKVMIVISDGAPCSFSSSYQKGNYKGVPFKKLNCRQDDAEMRELNACVRYYRKKGVKVIGVAIDEADAIKGIYEEGTLDCTNLSKLPTGMLKLFKKYVLK